MSLLGESEHGERFFWSASPLLVKVPSLTASQVHSITICNHMPESNPVIRVLIKGTSVSLDQRLSPVSARKDTTGRGEGKGYSKRSRSNLLKALSSLDALPSHFATLGFPPSVSIHADYLKKAIDRLGKRLKRAFPTTYAFWKIEYSLNKRPHIHLFGDFGAMTAREVTDWLDDAWGGVVDCPLRHGTFVDVFLVAKEDRAKTAHYFAKAHDSRRTWIAEHNLGKNSRCWGKFNREAMKLSGQTAYLAEGSKAERIRDVLAKYAHDAASSSKLTLTKAEQEQIFKINNGYDVALHLLPGNIVDKITAILAEDHAHYGGVVTVG